MDNSKEQIIIGPWKVIHHKMPNVVKDALHKIKHYSQSNKILDILGAFNRFYIELFFENGASIGTTENFLYLLNKNKDLKNDNSIKSLISYMKKFLKEGKFEKFSYKNEMPHEMLKMVMTEINEAIDIGKNISPFIRCYNNKEECSIIVLF